MAACDLTCKLASDFMHGTGLLPVLLWPASSSIAPACSKFAAACHVLEYGVAAAQPFSVQRHPSALQGCLRSAQGWWL